MPVLVKARVNHKGKNLSPAAFRGTVSNQIYALTLLQGKKSFSFAKRVSCHRVSSVLGLLMQSELKEVPRNGLCVVLTFGTEIRGVSQAKCSDQDEEMFLLWGRLIHEQECS